MTAEDRDAQLTAYALNDSSLAATAVQEVESLIATDAAARRAVEETRQLAQILTAGLTAEQAATPAEAVVTIPMLKPESRKPTRWATYVVAASVLCVVVAGVFVMWSKQKMERELAHAAQQVAAVREQAEDASRKRPGIRYIEADNDANIDQGGETHAANNLRLQTPLHDPTSPPDSRGPAGGQAPGAPSLGEHKRQRDYLGSGEAFPGGPFAGAGFRVGMPRPPLPAKPGSSASRAPNLPQPRGDVGAKAGGVGLPDPAADVPPATEEAGPGPDRHLALIENAFTLVKGQDALSTFGVDVDTASYSMIRKYLTGGQLPPPNAVRLEEMVNYFPYTDKPPTGDEPFAVTVEMADCPWAPTHRLARLGLKAKPIDKDKRPPSNLVFLIDVSGSMFSPERLPLVKASLKLLVNQLGESDRIAMVAYAGNSGLVLDSTSVIQKDKIIDALDRLEAGGSTNGSSGIQQAYEVAQAHFIKGGTNRVILCTDGDWNVGVTSTDALMKLIEQKRETGVFLSVCGFGFGNNRDEMMVRLAGKGNGNYAYIDTLQEAHKVFVEQLGGTLVTVAKDVKIQIEFNPAVVQSYRLLGYEKRILAAKDFHDDTKDSGEMGAGHVVTALYELVPAGVADPAVGKVDGLRYQKEPDPKPAAKGVKTDEAFVVKMRHKKPDANVSTLRELTVKNETKPYEKASEDFQFAASVASFAMILRESQYKGDANYGLVLELAAQATKHDPSGYRAEFVELVKKAKTLAGK